MSDFKVSIKLSWRGMGVEESTDMYINYWEDSECHGVDQRVIDFFRATWEKAYAQYKDGVAEYIENAEAAAERAEYERLKAKFGE